MMNKHKQYLVLLFAIFMVLCTCNAVHAEIELPNNKYEPICGDVNLDGRVAMADVQILLTYCSGITNLNDMQCKNGDVNCDNQLNTGDVAIIMKHIVGIINKLPYSPTNNQWENSIILKNNNFPKNGKRIAYGKPYSINATVLSESAITMVRIRISDVRDETVEIDESVYLDAHDDIRSYNTQTAEKAIDKLIRFSALSTGEKKLELICSSEREQNAVICQTNFRVGFTYSEVAGYVYNRNDEVSSSEARNVLIILNSLDYTNAENAKVIESGIKNLGKNYKEMDCSKFVQTAIKDALNIDLPRTSVDQAIYCADRGYLVDKNSMKPGDIIFMSRTNCDCGRYHEVHHSAIYMGSNDGVDYIIESASSMDGVIIRRIWGISGDTWIIDSVARVWK